MITVTQLVYIREGQEETFHRFEDLVLPVISRYNGHLMLRIRPSDDATVEASIERPYEIHLVEFRDRKMFNDFMNDEERIGFLHLKEQSRRSSVLIVG